MRFAIAYGADAVYAGPPRYSLRARNNEFTLPTLARGIEEAHHRGKKFYCTVNLLPHNSKLKTFERDMEKMIACQPDALIMADPGLIALTRRRWPEVPIHLSVQANAVNWASVAFWHETAGVERIILSRELSLDDIREIGDRCPTVELEVFVHGALCIAYSGRCLLSGYFNHRDPNQGTCTNACRWNYKVHGGITATQHNWFLEEEQRPGQLMPIEEDEHGTYIMNSKDLRAIEHVHALTQMGIHCLKIEGRTKSHYYVARTAQSYRRAITDACAGREFNPNLLSDLENLANRGYTSGFFQRHRNVDRQNYLDSHPRQRKQQFCAEIEDYNAGLATLVTKNKMQIGDRVEVIQPHGNFDAEITYMENTKGERIQEAKGGGMQVKIPLPKADVPYAMVARYL